MRLKRLAVMVSGGGSNLGAVMSAIDRGEIQGQIVLVISSKPGVYALERAQNGGVPTKVISKKDFASQEAFDQANLEALEGAQVDGVILAGYMSIVSPQMVRRYENRIINIHPALIPSFCGMGY